MAIIEKFRKKLRRRLLKEGSLFSLFDCVDADENPAYVEKEKKDKNMDFYRQRKNLYGKEELQPLQDGQFDDINIDLSKYLITREEFINKLDKHDLTVGQD